MLCFLKLGGSLITDKAAPKTPRPATLARLASEISAALRSRPDLRLLLGHGSGSFGHVEAAKYGTRAGVQTAEEWRGFAEVSRAAARLNRLVTDSLMEAGVPVIGFQPSASARCRDGTIEELALAPIRTALERGLAPLLYGDVAFDEVRGGTIISTEDIFRFLAPRLRPARILLAGIERGVYADWPQGRTVIPRLTPSNASQFFPALGGSPGYDVTGGMVTKVAEMLALTAEDPHLQILIFSGETPGQVYAALSNETAHFGTIISGY